MPPALRFHFYTRKSALYVQIRKHFSQILRKEQFGAPVHARGRTVDDDQVFALKIPEQSRGGIYRQRRAPDDQSIRLRDGAHRARYHAVFQRFFIQYDVGLYQAAAIAIRYPVFCQKVGHGMRLSAFYTKIPPHAAVQFKNLFTARFLMQSVDVLRDDRAELSPFFQPRQSQMTGVGLGGGKEHFSFIKAVKFGGFLHEERMGNDTFGRVLVFLIVQPVRRAEIGNTAFRTDPCAAEKHRVAFL